MKFKKVIFTFFFFLLLLFSASPAFAAIAFSISNPTQNGEEITLDASLSGLTSTSCLDNTCYLQSAFKAVNINRYFGYTKNNKEEWYEYNGSPGVTDVKDKLFSFAPLDGAWSGKLTIKINQNSEYYSGPAKYDIKAWRYSGNADSSSGESNIISFEIAGPTLTPTPLPTSTSSPTPIPTLTPSKTPTPSKSPTPTKTPTLTNIPTSKPQTSTPTTTITSTTSLTKTPTVKPTPTGKILGKNNISTASSVKKQNSPTPIDLVLADRTKKSDLPKILLVFGGLFLIGMGASILWTKKFSSK